MLNRRILFCFIVFLEFAFTGITEAQRKTVSLNGEWMFCVDPHQQGVKDQWYKQGLQNEKEVVVPHTWNASKETATFEGWGWYQKKVNIPQSFTGKNIVIQFNAVYHDAKIWINGKVAGSHSGSGFTKFFIETSDLFVKGENVISVLVDNSFSPYNLPFLKSFDWPNDGGIIRPVSLIVSERPSIRHVFVSAKTDFSKPGIKEGSVDVRVKLADTGKIALRKVKLMVQVKEENQKTSRMVYKGTPEYIISGNILSFNLKLDSINPWHFDDPNLYKIHVLTVYNERITDDITTNFGFRELKVDGHKLVFNGEYIRTAGVEAMPGSSLINGMAETEAELESYLKKIVYLNCNFIRFHWQQDDFVLDWCDRNGIMVQEELPIWGNKTLLVDTVLDIALFQLREMIENHYNHPSIVAWGIGNELAARDTKIIESVKTLYSNARLLDNGRLSNYVSNTLQQSFRWMPAGTNPDAANEGDILMYNDYHTTWYRQPRGSLFGMLDTMRAENENKPLIISEFGLCQPENYGDDNTRIRDMIYSYGVYESKSYIAGVIYFSVNDYRTHMGGGKYDFHSIRVHGVYDIEGNPKPSAAFLRDLNSPIQITGINLDSKDDFIITYCGNLGFPSFTLKGYKAYWSRDFDFENQSESKVLPDVIPGQTYEIKLAGTITSLGVLTIANPRGKVVYQQKVTQTPFKY